MSGTGSLTMCKLQFSVELRLKIVQIDQFVLDGVFYEVAGLVEAQFVDHVVLVILHRAGADKEGPGDLLGGLALYHQAQDVQLALAQGGGLAQAIGRAADLLQDVGRGVAA